MKTLFTSALFLFCFFESYTQTFPQSFQCHTEGAPFQIANYNEIGYFINNSAVEINGCQLESAIIVAVIDSNCQTWNTCQYNFGQLNTYTLTSGTCASISSGIGTCRTRPENYFIFQYNDPNQMSGLANMIDSVPNDNFILAYTWFNFPYSNVPLFKQVFQNIGASQITTLPDNFPYIFFIKKGDLSTLVESSGNSTSDTINLNTTINCTPIATVVSEMKNELINIFPNPSNNNLSISVANGNYKWEIYSVTGQQVLSGIIVNGYENIDTGVLSPGLYIIKLSDEKGTVKRIFGKL